jgi:hypothetical protein
VSAAAPSAPTPVDQLHRGFLALLPQVEARARFAFRHYYCPHDRADAVAEVLALAWKWYRRLAERGKDPAAFPRALAAFASRHARAGRRLCGQEDTRDALSPTARRRRGFAVGPLPVYGTPGGPWQEALVDNTRSPVPEQASFRIDFPAWLSSLDRRRRSLARQMALGHRTHDLAARFGVSPARVSQLRRELLHDWRRFHGESDAAEGHPVNAAA